MADVQVNEKKKPFFARMAKYFRDTKSELKKVTWPTAKQLKQNTGVILVFILMICIFLFVFDIAFIKLTGLLTAL